MVPSSRPLDPDIEGGRAHGFELVHGHPRGNHPAIALCFHGWFLFSAARGGARLDFDVWVRP
jgi:hypothetical protein